MYIHIDEPADYLLVCFTELADPKQSNASEILTFATYEEAARYGENWCRSIQGYPAEAHCHIWKFCNEGESTT